MVISWSQYSMYETCNYKWKKMYIDKIRVSDINIYLIFGKAFHTTMQQFLTILYNKTISEAVNDIDVKSLLRENMIKEFKDKENTKEYVTEDDMINFYYDGIDILKYIKINCDKYFRKADFDLVGCEVPLEVLLQNNVSFIGYIDFVILNKSRGRFKLYDIKTSTRGWDKYAKYDKSKIDQLLLYKMFYSKQYDISLDLIDIEFFVVKRKIYENSAFPQPKVQKVIPASGKPSINKVMMKFNNFINTCFTPNGDYNLDREYKKTCINNNCRFCDLKNKGYCK